MKFPKSASNSRDLKVLNRLLVLNTIRKQGPIARYEVAKTTGLTPPTVTVIVNDLIRAGVVNETGAGESNGGRKPVLLELNPRSGYILAVRLQHGEIMAALLDLGSNVLESRYFKLDTAAPETVVDVIAESLHFFLERTGIAREQILWCGVASPGLIDCSAGMLERSFNLGWKRVPLGPMLTERLSAIPVHIENISNAAALGEKVYGGGRAVDDLIYINLSIGIGAGIIIDKEVYHGVQGYAGEIGHIALYPEKGPKCSCGQYGCFEAVCGIRAVIERIRAEIPDEVFSRCGVSKVRLTPHDLLNPLFLETAEVKKVLGEIGRLAGVAIANLVSLFNIPTVILGGELSRTGGAFLDAAVRQAKEGALPEIGETLQIICSTMREDPPLIGIYALVLDKVFATDQWLA